ncbi:MAG: hypothetical protein U1F41_10250 [Burkholderiales bacterium]
MGARLPACAIGDNDAFDDSVEFVVQSTRGDEHETWLVMRADAGVAARYEGMGLTVGPGARVVVEAASMRPIGVIERPPPPSHPAGFNPYFDLPAS